MRTGRRGGTTYWVSGALAVTVAWGKPVATGTRDLVLAPDSWFEKVSTGGGFS